MLDEEFTKSLRETGIAESTITSNNSSDVLRRLYAAVVFWDKYHDVLDKCGIDSEDCFNSFNDSSLQSGEWLFIHGVTKISQASAKEMICNLLFGRIDPDSEIDQRTSGFKSYKSAKLKPSEAYLCVISNYRSKIIEEFSKVAANKAQKSLEDAMDIRQHIDASPFPEAIF